MKLVILTPENEVENELKIVNDLLAHGLQHLHIRKPWFTPEDYKNYLTAIDPEYHPRIVLHGAYELCKEFDISAIHLSTSIWNDNQTMERLTKLGHAMTASFHSWDEICDDFYPYKYVFLSPVFDSISKVGYKANLDLRFLKLTRNEMPHKDFPPVVIGLGGVDIPQIKILHQHKFDGAAMLGAIWNSPDPVNKLLEVNDVINSLVDG